MPFLLSSCEKLRLANVVFKGSAENPASNLLIEKYLHRENSSDAEAFVRAKCIVLAMAFESVRPRDPHYLNMQNGGSAFHPFSETMRLNHYWGERGIESQETHRGISVIPDFSIEVNLNL